MTQGTLVVTMSWRVTWRWHDGVSSLVVTLPVPSTLMSNLLPDQDEDPQMTEMTTMTPWSSL